MTRTALLAAVFALAVRRCLQLRRALTTAHGCERSWCCVDLGDDDCPSVITIGGVKGCTLRAGHDGLHQRGSWGWTDGIAAADIDIDRKDVA